MISYSKKFFIRCLQGWLIQLISGVISPRELFCNENINLFS